MAKRIVRITPDICREGMFVHHMSTGEVVWKIIGTPKNTRPYMKVDVECVKTSAYEGPLVGQKTSCNLANLYMAKDFTTNRDASVLLEQERQA